MGKQRPLVLRIEDILIAMFIFLGICTMFDRNLLVYLRFLIYIIGVFYLVMGAIFMLSINFGYRLKRGDK